MERFIPNHDSASKELRVLEEYGVQAESHISRSNGRMVLLDARPGTGPNEYEAQMLDCHRVVSTGPLGAGLVDIVATQAQERFPVLREQLKTPENHATIQTAGEILKRGHNIMIVTNHGDTIDIALALAAVYCELDEIQRQPQTGIIISKMISRIGYVINQDEPATPAVDALKMVCDDIFLSFPRTETMKKSQLFSFLPDHIDQHNQKIRKEIRERQESDNGYLLAVAGSGTTDKPSTDNPNVYHMGSLSQGTIDMMRQANTYVLPISLFLEGEAPVFSVNGLRSVTSDQEAHQVMLDNAQALNESVEGKTFVYRPETIKKLGKTATN